MVIGLYRDKLAQLDSPGKELAGLIVLATVQFGKEVGTTRRLVLGWREHRDYASIECPSPGAVRWHAC